MRARFYIDPATGLPHIYNHDVSEGEVLEKPGEDRAGREEEIAMSQNKLPAGWDEEKVRRVLAYYEEQTEEDALVEDAAGVEPSETVMNIPHDLVSKVRELIGKSQS